LTNTNHKHPIENLPTKSGEKMKPKQKKNYSKNDNVKNFKNALKNEIPDIWWKTYHKLS
jgi:hypothetical protein